MYLLIALTIINTLAATYFVKFMLLGSQKLVQAQRYVLQSSFFIIYSLLFYYIQTVGSFRLQNWYIYDFILCFIAGAGYLTAFYSLFRKLGIIKNG